MDKYTQLLEFFLEQGISLTDKQIDSLKEICSPDKLVNKLVVSDVDKSKIHGDIDKSKLVGSGNKYKDNDKFPDKDKYPDVDKLITNRPRANREDKIIN
jgi:hypothetical protein